MQVIPDWVPPAPPAPPSQSRPDATGQTRPNAANDAAKYSKPNELQIAALGRDQVIPIVYGGPERMAGLIYCAGTPRTLAMAGKLVFAAILCEGPVEDVSGFEVNGEPVPAWIQIKAYKGGTDNVVDPWLAAAIPGFNETLPGVCYFVAQCTPQDNTGFPVVTALVKGHKVVDPRGKSANFNGAGNAITCASAAHLNFGTGSFTIEAWAFVDDTTYPKAILPVNKLGSPYNTTPGWACDLGYNDIQYFFYLCDGPNFGSYTIDADEGFKPSQVKGQWVHFAWVVDRTANVLTLLINGTPQSDAPSIAAVTGSVDNSSAVALGTGLGWWHDGRVDEFRMWNVARTVAQIQDSYKSRASGLETGLVACLHLDDAASAAAGPVLDSSMYAHAWATNAGNMLGAVGVNDGVAESWSRNPALCLAHYLSHYGGLNVETDYTAEAANRCDEIVTGSAGSEKRCEMTLALNQKRELMQWADILRQYVPARLVNAGDAWRIVADMPRAVAHSFGPDNISGDNPPTGNRDGSGSVPNAVDIQYTDEQTVPWEGMIAHAELSGASSDYKISRVDLPGIRKYSQAYRFAVERLNHYTLEDLTVRLHVFDYGAAVLPGDICAVSEAAFGWAAKEFICDKATDEGNGRWTLDLREYDRAIYSGLVQTAPSMPDTALTSSLECSPANNVVVSQVLTPESNLSPNGVGTSIIYQSRIRVTWDESLDPYIGSYRVVIRRGGNEVSQYSVARGVGLFLSQPAQQLTTYDVDVYAVNTLGVLSPVVTNSIFIDGKTAAPSDVPAITQAMEIGGEVLLSWEPAVDFDIIRYEWRVDLGNTGAAWEALQVLDRIDGLRARFRGVPEGTHRFCIRAIDSVGNYSANSRCAVLTVTLDENAFVRGHDFVNPTLVGMVRIDTPPTDPPVVGTYPRWVTNDPAKPWDTAMPSPIDAGTAPVFTYGAGAGIASWTGEIYDVGATLTASFRMFPNETVFSGSIKTYLEHSLDANTWEREELSENVGWTGTARFIRPYIEGSAGASFLISGMVTVEIVANATSESGQATSSASTFSRVTLQKRYAKAVSVTVTPINTAEARFPTVDNLVIGTDVVNSFDVYIHKANGQQSADDYLWNFEGV